MGFHQIYLDHSIFVTNERVHGPIITIFINDLNIFAPHGNGFISQIKSELVVIFDMVDIKPLAFHIGLKVTQDWEKIIIKLFQPEYIEKPLNHHGLLKAKTTKVPMQKTTLLLLDTPISDLQKPKYSAKISSIIYIIVKTSIHIAFATSIVSQFAKNPGLEYFNIINQISHYLATSHEKAIRFGEEKNLTLVGYSDFDWAKDHTD